MVQNQIEKCSLSFTAATQATWGLRFSLLCVCSRLLTLFYCLFISVTRESQEITTSQVSTVWSVYTCVPYGYWITILVVGFRDLSDCFVLYWGLGVYAHG